MKQRGEERRKGVNEKETETETEKEKETEKDASGKRKPE
jgi:hypothetical protein